MNKNNDTFHASFLILFLLPFGGGKKKEEALAKANTLVQESRIHTMTAATVSLEFRCKNVPPPHKTESCFKQIYSKINK